LRRLRDLGHRRHRRLGAQLVVFLVVDLELVIELELVVDLELVIELELVVFLVVLLGGELRRRRAP
jgi:hypothetical protein